MDENYRIVEMGEDQYFRLFNIVNWYSQRPNEKFDHFDEAVAERVADLLPAIPELESGTHYYETPDVVDGMLWLRLEPVVRHLDNIEILLTH